MDGSSTLLFLVVRPCNKTVRHRFVHNPLLAHLYANGDYVQKNGYLQSIASGHGISIYGGCNEMETLLTHCAGMDVHQESIVVCSLIGEKDNSDIQTEIKTFGTTTRQLFELLTWLESKGITHIAMESTGIYWRPVYNILEGYFDIVLANAHRIKNVPGRKTDVSDAEWRVGMYHMG
jgi:transposase